MCIWGKGMERVVFVQFSLRPNLYSEPWVHDRYTCKLSISKLNSIPPKIDMRAALPEVLNENLDTVYII